MVSDAMKTKNSKTLNPAFMSTPKTKIMQKVTTTTVASLQTRPEILNKL